MENNILLLTDSYKSSHWKQYAPGTTSIYSYFESRGGKFPEVTFFGLQYFLKKYLAGVQVTEEKIQEAKKVWDAHLGPGFFNEEGWRYILEAHGGRLPVRIRAVPEGTTVGVSNVLMTIENTDPKCFWLTNYLETLLVQVWYPTTVCTLSREIKKVISSYLEDNGDPAGLDFKLHDFGFRGVSSVESAAIGGAAHLVNFKGTDTMAANLCAMKYYNSEMPGFSIPACYDDETEILTDRGFVFFKELNETYKVAQYTEDGLLSFVRPDKIHSGPYRGNMITFSTKGTVGAIDLVVTPNHRMVRRSLNTGKLEIQQAADAKFSQKNEIPQAGVSNVDHLADLTPLDRLRIAFQADGSFVSRAEVYTGERTGTRPIRFSFKKERKIDRLRSILQALGTDWTEYEAKNGYVQFWVPIPKEVDMTKDFSWVDLSRTSAAWASQAWDEIVHWDGKINFNTMMYVTSDKACADVVQALGVLAGDRTSMSEYEDPRGDRKTQYTVFRAVGTNSRCGQGIVKGTVKYSGHVYCVSVPSGMVVVRRNGYVAVCGNSEHSTITSWGRKGELDAYKNMLEQYPTGLVACVSDSYNIFNACEKLWGGELKDKVLSRDGTLVIRPDSGDPVTTILQVLDILGTQFGYTKNEKGYRVLPPQVRVIQGDGVDYDSIKEILQEMDWNDWSADNIAFGMGGALLQKLNRDTQKFAFKCSEAVINGEGHGVSKDPVGDKGKRSKTGRLALVVDSPFSKTYKTIPARAAGYSDVLVTVFENGAVLKEYSFDEIRERAIIND